MNEIAAIGLHTSLARTADAPTQLAREFDAMVFRMLWRTAAAPGARGAKSATPALGATFADFFAPQMAAQHSAGFGALALAALDPGRDPLTRSLPHAEPKALPSGAAVGINSRRR